MRMKKDEKSNSVHSKISLISHKDSPFSEDLCKQPFSSNPDTIFAPTGSAPGSWRVVVQDMQRIIIF